MQKLKTWVRKSAILYAESGEREREQEQKCGTARERVKNECSQCVCVCMCVSIPCCWGGRMTGCWACCWLCWTCWACCCCACRACCSSVWKPSTAFDCISLFSQSCGQCVKINEWVSKSQLVSECVWERERLIGGVSVGAVLEGTFFPTRCILSTAHYQDCDHNGYGKCLMCQWPVNETAAQALGSNTQTLVLAGLHSLQYCVLSLHVILENYTRKIQ